MKTQLSLEILKSFGENDHKYVDEFEMTAGEEIAILAFLSKLIVNKSKPEIVENLIKMWKQEDVVSNLLALLLQTVIDQITDSGKVITEDPVMLIENLTSFKSLPGPELSSKLGPLCTN